MSLNDLPKVNPSSDNDDQLVDKMSVDQPISQKEGSIPTVNSGVAGPDEAADTDLIEKEWVERAKQIVEHTKNDPHEQQKALSRMKADYMKKRYNKDIKVSNE